ncbi:MAG: DUF3892 domain-containing protein [Polyangiaceae bacterium]
MPATPVRKHHDLKALSTTRGTAAFGAESSLNGTWVYVGVIMQGPGAPYLRTHADGVWNDNLHPT